MTENKTILNETPQYIDGYLSAIFDMIIGNGEVDDNIRFCFKDKFGDHKLSYFKKLELKDYNIEFLNMYWTDLHKN